MWYIFKEDKCIATCDSELNLEDLASRGETAVESDKTIPIHQVIKDDTSSIIQRPIPELTVVQIKIQKLNALDAEYQPQFAELSQALGMATLADNAALIASIKVDYADVKTEYDNKRGEING